MNENIRIAIYIRLSMADEDTGKEKDESNSVVNQRSLIHRFLDNHEELSLYPRTEFVDDGFSGTNTERPAYQNLMNQLNEGKFQVLVTKDFSRANRDYLEMGELIEYTLPSLGVRYISINDGYDSSKYIGTTGGLDVVMRAIVYDAYSKDLSVKESTAKKLGRKKGRRTGGYPGYGYIRDPENIGNDILDPDAAKIVRRIFDEAIAGKSLAGIARGLNEDHVPTPSEYFKLKHPGTNKYNNVATQHIWIGSVIRQILERYAYTGASVGGIRKQTGPCSKHTKKASMDDWIVVPDMHEAIVTVEEWQEAQKVLNKTGIDPRKGGSNYPLKSLIICGNCGRHMHRYSTIPRFKCKYGDNNGTVCKKIRSHKESELNQIVYGAIQNIISLTDKKKAELSQAQKANGFAIRTETLSADQLQKQIAKLRKDKLKVYDKYASNIIAKEDYLRQKSAIDEKIRNLEERILKSHNRIQEMEDNSQSVSSEIEALCKAYRDETELTYDMAHAFVDHVTIHAGGEVEIFWKFKDIFKTE